MTLTADEEKVVQAVESAAAGVDYSARLGARCPWCGARTKIYKTLPWVGDVRVRYHRCPNSGCILSDMGTTVKSVQVDYVAQGMP